MLNPLFGTVSIILLSHISVVSSIIISLGLSWHCLGVTHLTFRILLTSLEWPSIRFGFPRFSTPWTHLVHPDRQGLA